MQIGTILGYINKDIKPLYRKGHDIQIYIRQDDDGLVGTKHLEGLILVTCIKILNNIIKACSVQVIGLELIPKGGNKI